MKTLRKKSGFTFIETMISAIVVTFVILATINLMTSVYKGIVTLQQKTFSTSIATEELDLMKQTGFANLPITPDDCLPEPLNNLYSATNLMPPVTSKNTSFGYTVFKVVQQAQEDSDGTIKPVLQADLPADADLNIKYLAVYVAYQSMGVTKTTRATGLLANREIGLKGSSVSGRIYKILPSGTPVAPGVGSNATVYVVGFPEYTSLQYDANGNYTIENVMPGSFILHAAGVGFADTYYASNPLVISSTAQTITGVNFNCAAVDGASVTGNVYIGIVITPSATPTPLATVATAAPTAVCNTAVLMATGIMGSKVSDWDNHDEITYQDSRWASESSTNDKLIYTNFDDTTIANVVISNVEVKAYTQIRYLLFNPGTRVSNLQITNNSGTSWANTCCPSPNGWTGTITTSFAGITFANAAAVQSINITSLYTTWDWAKVNALGAAVRTKNLTSWSGAYMDAMWLEVDYCQFTPTPVNTNTFTPTPNSTPTATPIPCANGAIVKALDGLSLQTTTSGCYYQITDINPATGFTSVSASFAYAGRSYYKLMTGVPVAASVTTYLDIMLEETSGIPTINGFVYDAQNTSLPLVGVDVYLSDPTAVSPTTSGGGAYTINPADTGTWTLYAAAPGYVIQNNINITVVNGINTAPNIYMYRVGDLSGVVTDYSDGSPVAGREIQILDSSNTVIKTGTSDVDGNYLIKDIPVAANYKVYINLTSSGYTCSFPSAGYYKPVSIIHGGTVTNKNFKIKQTTDLIKGKIQLNGADIPDGVMVLAYPSSVTYHAQDYIKTSTNPLLQSFTGRNRMTYPIYGFISQRDASYSIDVPTGVNYDIYAYYSIINYTTNPRTVTNYYKKITGIAPGSSGQDITGNLSAWTPY